MAADLRDLNLNAPIPATDVANTPAGTIAATDVQGAINELDSEKIGSGAAAGGVLSGTYPNPGFAVDMATQAELDAAIATAVLKSLVDAKGDLIVATANDTVARQAIGSDGTVLTADSAQTNGLKWVAAAGGFSYVGYNTVGATYETLSTARVYTKKITLATDGLLTSIEAYVRNDPGGTTDQVESLSVCLYSDDAGAPDRILGYNVGTTVLGGATGPAILMDNTPGAGGADRPRWVALAIAKWLTAGDYWISVANLETNSVMQIPYDSGTDRYYTSGGQWFADWGFYTPTTTARQYSIRAGIKT